MDLTQPFFDDIRANPFDDTPRLVFADWLEDRGEEARAEFIRIQCERAQGEGDDPERARRLWLREIELWGKHREEWSAPLRAFTRRYAFTRGFAEDWTLKAKVFLDHADTIFTLAPVWHLKFRELKWHVKSIAQCEAISKLASIDLDFAKISNGQLETFLSSPYLKQVKRLNLSNNSFSLQGMEHLAATSLPNLEVLILNSNQPGINGFAALAKAPWLPQLKVLKMSSIGLRSKESLEAILEKTTSLEELDVSKNGDLRPEGLRPIAESPSLSRLKQLAVRDFRNQYQQLKGEVGDYAQTLEAIVTSPHLRNLEVLDLSGCHFVSDSVAQAIGGGAALPNIRSLSLHDAYVSRLDCRQSPVLSQLEELYVTDGTMVEELTRTEMPRLRKLHIYDNRMGAEITKAIAQCQNWPRLTALKLAVQNPVEDPQTFANNSLLAQLHELDMQWHRSDEGLAEALLHSPQIERICKLSLKFSKYSSLKSALTKRFRSRLCT